MKKEEVVDVIDAYNELSLWARCIATKYAKITNNIAYSETYGYGDEVEFDSEEGIDKGRVLVPYSRDGSRGCGYDDDNIIFPMSYLWDENWERDLKDAIRRKQEECKKEEAEEYLRSEKERAERRRKTYEELKKEFEGDGDESSD